MLPEESRHNLTRVREIQCMSNMCCMARKRQKMYGPDADVEFRGNIGLVGYDK